MSSNSGSYQFKLKKIPTKLTKSNQSAEGGKTDITNIYQDEEGRKVNMTRLDRKKGGPNKIVILALIFLFVLALAALAGFFIFRNSSQKLDQDSITIDLQIPKDAASGEKVSLVIKYYNQDSVALDKLELNLRYPQGFYLITSDPRPEDEYNNYWDLGSLGSGKGGHVKVTGQLIGEIGTDKTFFATATYRPANFNYDFQVEKNISININSSILDIEPTVPTKAIDSQEIEYALRFRNESELTLEKIKINLDYPDDFEIIIAEPSANEGNNSWLINSLLSKEEKQIKIKGIIHGQAGEMEEIKAQVGLIGEDNVFRLQKELSNLILIVKPELDLQITLNGLAEDQIIFLGDTLSYELTYKNISDLELQDMVLKLQIKGQSLGGENDLIDFTSLNTDSKARLEGNQLIWDKDNLAPLALVKPQAGGAMNLSVKLKPDLKITNDLINLSVVSIFGVDSVDVEELPGADIKIENKTITSKIATQLSLQSEGRYYTEEFEQIGFGPLPPMAGATTSYYIFWYVSNTTNDARDIVVTTTIPSDVYWTGKGEVSTGDSLDFDAATRKLTWRINKLPAGTGLTYPVAQAKFEVSVTPGAEKVGKLLILTNETSMTGKDDFTGKDLSDTNNLITSDLENDVTAQGKGVVVPNSNNNSNSNSNLNNNLNVNTNSNVNGNQH